MTGCTPFLVNLLTTPVSRLGKADSRKLAEKYGLSKWSWGEGWVEMCVEAHRRRG